MIYCDTISWFSEAVHRPCRCFHHSWMFSPKHDWTSWSIIWKMTNAKKLTIWWKIWKPPSLENISLRVWSMLFAVKKQTIKRIFALPRIYSNWWVLPPRNKIPFTAVSAWLLASSCSDNLTMFWSIWNPYNNSLNLIATLTGTTGSPCPLLAITVAARRPFSKSKMKNTKTKTATAGGWLVAILWMATRDKLGNCTWIWKPLASPFNYYN